VEELKIVSKLGSMLEREDSNIEEDDELFQTTKKHG